MSTLSTASSNAASSATDSPLGDTACSGCNKVFTVSGLSKHLSQTRKSACVAVRIQRQSGLLRPPAPAVITLSEPSGASSAAEPQRMSLVDVDMEAAPIPFEGDFFGDYTADEFEDLPISESADESDDDDDDHDTPVPSGWEPPPLPPSQLHALPTSHPSTSDLSEARTSIASAANCSSHAERNAAEATAQKRKTHVVSFPLSTAAAPMTTPLPPNTSTYQQYGAAIDDADLNNPYAPFTSRIDWQLARWAKLRGPGSTAFSDLLAIEEVRHARRCTDVSES